MAVNFFVTNNRKYDMFTEGEGHLYRKATSY